MKSVPLFIVLLLIFKYSLAARIVCYYSSWAIYYQDPAAAVLPQNLNPNLCTHINYAFVNVNADGTLSVLDDNADIQRGGYANTVALKQVNADLKVLLSIGGGNVPADLFASIAADPGKRANLVQSARNFLETYGFDGIDVDWEVPRLADKDNFAQLLEDLKSNFQNNGWLVTAALPASPQEGYDVPRINQALDIFNIMTYDMYGPDWSSYTGQNSALFASDVESEWERSHLNIASCVDNWINAGANPDKLVFGLAFYGHTYTLQDPSNNGLHAPFTSPGNGGIYRNSPGSLSYVEFCSTQSSWTCNWDDQQKNPICISGGNQWLGTDNGDSIAAKVQYLNSRGVGGVMIWSVDQDDVHGNCGETQQLLKIVNDNL